MKQKKHKGSKARVEEGATVIVDLENGYAEEEYEEDDFVTQIIKGPSSSKASSRSQSKLNSQKKKNASSTVKSRTNTATATASTSKSYRNGYRIREVNVSEIPNHLISNMKMAQVEGNDEDNLTLDSWNCRNSSAKGGVWIFQCPKDVDVMSLLYGRKISLDGDKTVLPVVNDTEDDQLDEDKQFEAISVDNVEHKKGAMLLLPGSDGFTMVSTPIQGHIIIRESLKEVKMPEVAIPVPKPRALPSGIKERHPIYGTDFSDILEKMNNAKLKVKSPHKKKSSVPILISDTQQTPPNGFRSNYSVVYDSKISDVHNNDEIDYNQKKKSKKTRRDHNDAPSIVEKESYQDNCSVLIDFSTRIDTEDESSTLKKKKSKKRKRSEMEDSNEYIIDFDTPATFNTPVKKSKKVK